MNQKSKFKQTEIGMIPEEWEEKRLGDCLKLIRKLFSPSKDDVCPYIGLEHIEQQTLRLMGFGSSNDVESNKFEFKAGQILFGKLRPYFRKLIRPKFNGVCSTDIWVIDTKGENDNAFFFYFLAGQRIINEANNSSEGTRMPRARWDYLEQLKLPIPPLAEQRAIAKILSDLDAKIELNQQMNKTLEEIGRAIFKHWFVDFEFPDEEGKPYKSAGGEMVFNEELRKEIPKGWEVGRVADLVSIKTGFAFKSSSFDDSGIYGLVTIKNVMDGFFVAKCTDRISIVPSEMPEYCLLKSGDIIMSLTGNVGRVCFVYGNNYLLNQRVAKLSPNNSNNNAFIYFLFRQPTLKDNLINISKGTAQQNLSPIEAKELNLIIPPSSILDVFSSYMNPIFDFMIQNEINCKTLSQIRDALLPKLMSGKIRVPLEEKE